MERKGSYTRGAASDDGRSEISGMSALSTATTILPMTGKSCFCIPDTNDLRYHVYNIIRNKWFDRVMMAFIFINCVQMACERPSLDLDSMEAMIYKYVDLGCTIVFAVEAVMKIFAFNFHVYIKQVSVAKVCACFDPAHACKMTCVQ